MTPKPSENRSNRNQRQPAELWEPLDRPAWSIALTLGSGARFLGRIPPGQAGTAASAIATYLAMNPLLDAALSPADRARIVAVAR
jgi:hypothetical protein